MNRSEAQPSRQKSFWSRHEWGTAGLVVLGVSLAIVAPFVWLGNASGHDIGFHAASWVDVAAQWREGNFFPRWAEWANYGYGEPRFIFYPPLSWLLGAALVSLLPISAAAGMYIATVQTLAGISAYALARNFASRGGALIGAACFAANPDALLIIYVRSDYAELLAMAFYPLLLLAALRLCGWLRGKSGARRDLVFFALSFAAIWLANAPAGVIASYTAALIFAWGAITERSWKPVMRGAGGLALGFGLAAFYLIPAAYEESWVNIVQALSTGLKPTDNFLFTAINDPDHNHFNRVASLMGVLTVVLTLALATAMRRQWRRDGNESNEMRRAWWALLIAAAAACALMVKVTNPLWKLLPKLRFVQFPWRWMSIVAVVLCVCTAGALAGRKRAWVWVTALFVILASAAVYLGRNTWWDADDFPSIQDAVDQKQGFEGTDEYDPLDDDHLDLKQNQPQAAVLPAEEEKAAPRARLTVKRWTAENRVVEAETETPQRIALRLLDYPAWRVSVNGKQIQPDHLEGVMAMVVPVPAGKSMIEVEFTRTADRTIGGAVSGASLVLVALLYAAEKRKIAQPKGKDERLAEVPAL